MKMIQIFLKMKSLLSKVRPRAQKKHLKDVLITFGVVMNTDKQINRQTNEHMQKQNLLVEVITTYQALVIDCGDTRRLSRLQLKMLI